MKTFTKQIILLCMMTSITYIGMAQCHSWVDLTNPDIGVPTAISSVWGLATDQDNNVYSTSYFSGSISFGSITLTNPTGGTSFYINKLNSDGVIQWAIQLPVTTLHWGPVICQKNGMLYVACEFADTLVIGLDTITTSSGHYALFVLKLDLNGNIIGYIPEFGSTDNDLLIACGITVNSSNEIYITGKASGILNFDTIVLNSLKGYYAYLAKFSPSLKPIWAIQANSNDTAPNSRGWGISVDNNENVIIGGYFTGDISWGSQYFNGNNSRGGTNPYIAKFDSSGNCLWIRGGAGIQKLRDFSNRGPVYNLVTDISGNIYYSAALDSVLYVDGDTLKYANGNFYYCKYTPNGNLVWLKQAGNFFSNNDGDEAPTSLVIDNSNNLWSSGWIDGPATFGGYSLKHEGLFIAKLDLDGNFKGAIGSIGIDDNYPSALDTDGNLYVGGAGGGDTVSFDGDTKINIHDTLGVEFVLKFCSSEMGDQQLLNNDEQVSVYPDPTTGKFTVTFPGTTKQIQISNSLGQVLQTKCFENEMKMVFELTTSGIYFIKIKTDTQIMTEKLIVSER